MIVDGDMFVKKGSCTYICLPFQVPVASWFDDMNDRELLDLIPFFERVSKADNVYALLKSGVVGNANGNSSGGGGVMAQR